MLQSIFFILTGLTFTVAFLAGWSILGFLVNEGVIKKRTILICPGWYTLFEYYKIKKRKTGTYGLVGIIYASSIVALTIEGIICIFVW